MFIIQQLLVISNYQQNVVTKKTSKDKIKIWQLMSTKFFNKLLIAIPIIITSNVHILI